MEFDQSLETRILLRNALRLGVSGQARDEAALAEGIRRRLAELGFVESTRCGHCRRAMPDFGVCPYCSAPNTAQTVRSAPSDFVAPEPPRLRERFHPGRLTDILVQPFFWVVLLLATAPMVLKFFGLDEKWMFVFFSLLWAYVFFKVAGAPPGLWKAAAAGYVFTGMFALPLLVTWISIPPHPVEALLASGNGLLRFLGFTLGVGVREELAKMLVIVWMAHFRVGGRPVLTRPIDALLVGSVAGLGFAAIENMDYLERFQFLDRVHYTFGMYADNLSFRGSMSRVMLTPFVHAVWAGVLAWFTMGALQVRGRAGWRLFGTGLFIAAGLHGLYDFVAGVPDAELLLVLVVGVSFAAWMACLGGEQSSARSSV